MRSQRWSSPCPTALVCPLTLLPALVRFSYAVTLSLCLQAPFTLAEIYHVGAPGIDAFSTVAPNCSRAGRLFNIFISERSTWAKDLKSAALAYQAGDHWSALFRYLLVSEEGSRLASENAALLVAKGRGYKGTVLYSTVCFCTVCDCCTASIDVW